MTLWKSILKPDQSVVIALAVAGGVYAVYSNNMPSMAECHAAEPHNSSIGSSMNKAKWTSAGLVVGAYLLTRDPNVFIAGGAAFLAIEWQYRHANAVDPRSGKMVSKQAAYNGYQDTASAGDDEGSEDYSYA